MKRTMILAITIFFVHACSAMEDSGINKTNETSVENFHDGSMLVTFPKDGGDELWVIVRTSSTSIDEEQATHCRKHKERCYAIVAHKKLDKKGILYAMCGMYQNNQEQKDLAQKQIARAFAIFEKHSSSDKRKK